MLAVEIQKAVDDYLQQECQPDFIAECKGANDELLTARFAKRINFGTAGLRGVMAFGLNAMNSVTVRHATQGLCQYYINKIGEEEIRGRWVVLGFDGRYNSRYFAHLAAAIFLSKGLKVSLAPVTTATPLNPYAVKKLNAICGIQITASHNPKADNGYKVYGSNGAQIVPPMDSEVMELIKANAYVWPKVDELMRHDLKQLNTAHPLMGNVQDLMYDLWPNYKAEILSDLNISSLKDSPLRVVYTAMHGVGYPFVSDILRSADFPMDNFVVVPHQRDPDPDFTTVKFPNPEEKGAMDAAMEVANAHNVNMIVSNDPDADRFACSERMPNGTWRQFTGDELGSIFGAIAFESAKRRGIATERMAFICSAVSSRFLCRLCSVEGANFYETMTGFKWMMNKALEVQTSGLTPVFCYEEALGYGLSMAVPDKDGVSATAAWIQKASELAASGQSMHDYLDELSQKYGYFATQNSYYVCHDPSIMLDIFGSFRKSGYPTHIGEYEISRIRDLSQDYDSGSANKECDFPKSKDDMLTIYFTNGAHITLRGSGTEPKLKYYSEMSHASSKAEAASELKNVVAAVQSHLIGDRPLKHA